MAIYRCEACGASLNIEEGRKIFFCEYCGTKNVIEKEIQKDLGPVYLEKGQKELAQGDWAAAAGSFSSAIAKLPVSPEAHIGRLLASKQSKDLTALYNKVISEVDENEYMLNLLLNDENFKAAIRFAKSPEKEQLLNIFESVKNRKTELDWAKEFVMYFGCHNGEKMQWQILGRDEKGILVINRFAIDSKPFHNKQKGITWESCALRAWLNSDFYENAFTPFEKSFIKLSHLENPRLKFLNLPNDNPTDDRIFLLSTKEAEKFNFLSAQASYTPAAAAIYQKKKKIPAGNTCPICWFRTIYNSDEACTNSEGGGGIPIYDMGTFMHPNITYFGVRPAFYLDVEALRNFAPQIKSFSINGDIEALKQERQKLGTFKNGDRKKQIDAKIRELEEELARL